MAKDLVLLVLHGMGTTKEDFAEELKENLAKEMGGKDWGRVHCEPVYYQGILQRNQDAVFKKMREKEIDYIKLRKFLLFGFSDAPALERNAHLPRSPYERAQKKIWKALDGAYTEVGGKPKPVVIVAHSLGCQVISNYIWDAQSDNPQQGIWKNSYVPTTPQEVTKDQFQRLKTLKFLFSTGCNIPIFVAGFKQVDIRAIETTKKGYNFQWLNYYDEDDVLGWPLKPLSPSYEKAVSKDFEINSGGGFMGTLLKSWNPLSHMAYWEDDDFIEPLADKLRDLLK